MYKLLIPSLPNFRPVIPNDVGDADIPIYRSGDMTTLAEEDFEIYSKFGIKTIIDFRDLPEVIFTPEREKSLPIWRKAELCHVSLPTQSYADDEKVTLVSFKTGEENKDGRQGTNSSAENCENQKVGRYTEVGQLKDYKPTKYIFNPVANSETTESLIDLLSPDIPEKVSLANSLAALNTTGKSSGVVDYMPVVKGAILEILRYKPEISALSDIHFITLEKGAKAFVAALKLLSEPANLPGLVCCSVGKDRTGVASALLQYLLGKDDTFVGAEYRKTKELSEKYTDEYWEKYGDLAEVVKLTTFCNEQEMIGCFGLVEKRYGSLEKFLTLHGFGPEEQRKLRNNLRSAS